MEKHETTYYGYGKTLDIFKTKAINLVAKQDQILADSISFWLNYLSDSWWNDHLESTRMNCCGQRCPMWDEITGRIICESCGSSHTRPHSTAVGAWEEFLDNERI